MSSYDRESLRKWLRPLGAAIVLAALLAVVTAGIISGFGSGRQDVLRRTPTPLPPTRTPTIPNTPTDTLTPADTRTPTETPTPFPTKNRSRLRDTVIIGGSTGGAFLSTCCTSYVPLFDGGFGDSFGGAAHVTLPGAITHLSVRLDSPLPTGDAYAFSISVDGEKSEVACAIPAKGKGDFCEAGDKVNDCVEVGPQDTIAVQVVPKSPGPGGVAGGRSSVRMSWAAKLDLYGRCGIQIGANSCQGEGACINATGPIGDNSCNGEGACNSATGSIGDGSCNGSDACNSATGSIGNGSCDSESDCIGSSGGVGDNSCTDGLEACFVNVAPVGNGSCNGFVACIFNAGPVGDGSCDGYGPCEDQNGSVGNGSCSAQTACISNHGPVGNGSCNGLEACVNNIAIIGDGLCNAPFDCTGP